MRQAGRSQWLTDRGLQFKLILVLLLIGTLNLLFYLFTMVYFFNEINTLYMTSAVVAELPVDYMASQKQLLLKVALFGFLLQAALITLLGAYFSSRISGPIYRLNSVFKQILAGGEVPVVTLRRHDFMQEFKDNFNQVVQHYHGFREQVLYQLERLSESPGLSPECKQDVNKLIAKLKASYSVSPAP